jgi:hypothetical protein
MAMMVAVKGQQQQLEQKVNDLSTAVNKKIDDLAKSWILTERPR